MNNKGYKRGYYAGFIPCWYKEEFDIIEGAGLDVKGYNRICDFLIELIIPFEVIFSDGFYVKPKK